MDQLYPKAAMAVLEFLEKRGIDVEYPREQTCCGQPMSNSGCSDQAKPLANRFEEIFSKYDYVVCPSGSCTSMVRCHYGEHLTTEKNENLKNKTFEFCEFLVDILKIDDIDASFPYRVGLHQSCHGLRELRLANSTERRDPPFSKVRQLLNQVRDIELVDLQRTDECCGFGGTFAVSEEAISCSMGKDRIADHREAGAQVMTGIDLSCLMHLDGIMRKSGEVIPTFHVAEILNGNASL